MANKKAAKKYILVTRRNKLRNSHFRSLMKTMIKKATQAIENKDAEAETLVRAALKQIDKSKSKGLIHINCAARKKSKLAKKLAALGPIEKKETKKAAAKPAAKKAAPKKTTAKKTTAKAEEKKPAAKATEKKTESKKKEAAAE